VQRFAALDLDDEEVARPAAGELLDFRALPMPAVFSIDSGGCLPA